MPRWLGQLSAHGCQFVVWEAIFGPTLAQELAEGGPFTPAQIRAVAFQLLPVLHHIHGQGILHRNLSPSMVIRRQDLPVAGHASVAGHVPVTSHVPVAGHASVAGYTPVMGAPSGADRPLVLVGFGGMKLATATALAQPGTTTGIAAYAAPEQLMGHATFASDLYSLGVVLLHLLTGIHPFDLFSTTENRWVWRDFWAALDPPVAAELAQSSLPHALERLIARGLRDRAPSAIAAWQDWFPSQAMPQVARPQLARPQLAHPQLAHPQLAHPQPTAFPQTTDVSPAGSPTPSPIFGPTPGPTPGPNLPQVPARIPSPVPDPIPGQSPVPVPAQAPAPGSSPWQRVGTGSGHTGQITALQWMDDRTWVSASWDSTLRVWRSPDRSPTAARPWSSLQTVQTVTGHSSVITGMGRSPHTLASMSWDATLRLWQLDPSAASSPLEPFAIGTGHRGWITAIALAASPPPIAPGSPAPVAWITGGSDCTLRTWSATGELLTTITGLAADPTAIAPTPDGQGCLWGDAAGQLYCAPFTPESPITPLLPTAAPDAPSLNAPGSDAPAGAIVGVQWLAADPTLAALTLTAPILIVGWASGTLQRYAWTFDPPSLMDLSSPNAHPIGLTALVAHPNGRDWVTAGRDRTVILWDGATGQPRDRLPQTAIPTAIAVAPQGRAIVVGTQDRRMHLWQLSGPPSGQP